MRSLRYFSLLLIALAPHAFAQHSLPETITVSAADTVRVVPDILVLQFAVTTRGEMPLAVHQENEAATARALDAVRGLGVAEREIQVRGLMLSEDYRQIDGERTFVGYLGRRFVTVSLDDPAELPIVLQAIMREGVNQLMGTSYDVRDRRSLEDEALRRASARAREKAEVIASSFGATVLGLHSVTESDVSQPHVRLSGGTGGTGAYAPGEMEVRASLTATFLIQHVPAPNR